MLKVFNIFFVNLFLYSRPQIFNYIEVWRVGWPGKRFHLLFLQKVLCGSGCMNWSPILLKIKLSPPIILEYFSKFWKQIILKHPSVLHCVYTTTIAPKHFFFLTCSPRNKVKLTLTIVGYSCICMYLLFSLSYMSNRSLTLFCPNILASRNVNCINPYFAITKNYLFPVP